MSDIGVFSESDILLLIFIATLPGTVLGLILGTLLWKSRRIIGALTGALLGALFAFLTWVAYFQWFQ
ncbi:hypothetical protein FE840_013885 [Peteryoungia desertarenae]|uniref:Uncharacterized protein n=1 Tax=Peteryoungia desertarenae TaxID=1813451 RepID=A0ABX6QPN6_9HYPH|nr:hypothetical protein [Peteryoungia desertarenae]QLF70536.1 hypothetical protein FE840_013885 [Peteryoungia desertarenae]